MSGGSATATSFVGGCVSQAARSPTSSTGMCWKSAYIREYSVCSADVEAVVDVTVRRVPERGQQPRSPRARSRAGSARGARTCRSSGRRRRRPGNRRRGRRCPPPRGRAGPSGTSGPSRRPPGSRLPGSVRSRRGCAAAAARHGRRACGRSRRRRPGRRAGRKRGRISRRWPASTYAATSAIC